jgi:hypothetical protein
MVVSVVGLPKSRYSLNNMIDIDPGMRCVFSEDEKIEWLNTLSLIISSLIVD